MCLMGLRNDDNYGGSGLAPDGFRFFSFYNSMVRIVRSYLVTVLPEHPFFLPKFTNHYFICHFVPSKIRCKLALEQPEQTRNFRLKLSGSKGLLSKGRL